MSLKIEGVLITDEGRKREQNEDNYSFFGNYRKNLKQNKAFLLLHKELAREYLAVYDGMGGEDAGEVASLIAAQNFTRWPLDKVKTEGKEQVRSINRMICDKAKNGRMGTTMVGLYIDQGKAIYCNVGDSRGYLHRNHKIQLLTKDHSEGQSLVDGGFMTLEEAKKSKSWHKLTQHLGIFEDEFLIDPYYSEMIDVQAGDIFLLCTDGLSDLLMDEEIETYLDKISDLKTKARELVQEVYKRGARDNVTILMVKITDGSI